MDKVVISTLGDNPKKWFFLVGRWLATDEDDKQIVREVPASTEDGVVSAPLITYNISVKTGDRPGAGTDANVLITLFGEKGDSGERLLDKPGNNFERNRIDEFAFQSVDLGDLKRIVIRHDNSGAGPAWFLDKVIIESGAGGKWYFPCGRWLDKSGDDKQISREIGAIAEDVQTYTPMITYTLTVNTADRPGAGTSAGVYVTLVGENAQSDENRLESTGNAFSRNGSDVFSIRSVDLGKLEKLRIRLDDSGLGVFGAAWYLDKVIVKSEKDGEVSYFLHGDWIGKKKKLTVEIAASGKDGQTYKPMVTYTVKVTTGTCRGAGTDANVFIILYSAKRDSGKIVLEGPGNLFERGKTDVFQLKLVDLGSLKKIRIGHDGKGIGAGWFLDKVEIESSTGKKYNFPCSRWFDTSEGDKLIERDLLVDGEPGPKMLNYIVTVLTGKKRGSGTDANVHCSIIGSLDKVENVLLDNAKNNFESGMVDKFKIQTCDLGDLKEFIVWHDNSGLGPGWYLDRVYVEIEDQPASKVMFPCSRWLDKSEDDGQIKRNLVPGTVYHVRITTGKEKGAGTDSKIYCVLHGKTNLPETKLENSQNLNKFEAGQMDEFTIGSPSISPITHITLRSNDEGVGSDWLIANIEVEDEATGIVVKNSPNLWFKKKLTQQKFPLQ
uniref:PLAT domain-containing protein n=1 Tax=Arcella intermedia TaxID=1963864 RepID=A0A6B2KZF9_9EUKA